MAGIAFTLPIEGWLRWTLAIFWLLAFSSATHDVAADGFYMMALDEGNQSFFVGIRSTFYRLATLAGQGGMLIVVDWLIRRYGNEREAWIMAFGVVALLFVLVGIYHLLMLPRPHTDKPRDFAARDLLKEYENVRLMSKCQKSPYKYVCKWFEAKFPNYGKMVSFDEKGELVWKKEEDNKLVELLKASGY